jgi:hypothetical protein
VLRKGELRDATCLQNIRKGITIKRYTEDCRKGVNKVPMWELREEPLCAVSTSRTETKTVR